MEEPVAKDLRWKICRECINFRNYWLLGQGERRWNGCRWNLIEPPRAEMCREYVRSVEPAEKPKQKPQQLEIPFIW